MRTKLAVTMVVVGLLCIPGLSSAKGGGFVGMIQKPFQKAAAKVQALRQSWKEQRIVNQNIRALRRASPELNAAEAEQRQRVEGALESLSDKQREVLILHYFGGLTFREIARVTGVPLGTALGRMHYALRHLRKQCVEMEATP